MLREEEIARLRQQAAADPALTVRLCDMLIAAGHAEEAAVMCRERLMHWPDDVALRSALGRALSASGNLEEAQAALSDAVARKRRNTIRNIPTGPATPPPPRTPLNEAAFAAATEGGGDVAPSSSSRLGVPTPIAASGTARQRVAGNTSRHQVSPPPKTPPVQAAQASPPEARLGALRVPQGAPPPAARKLPPVSPPARRVFAPLSGAQRMSIPSLAVPIPAPPPVNQADLEPLPVPDIIPPELVGPDVAVRVPVSRSPPEARVPATPLPARVPHPPPLPVPLNPLPKELAGPVVPLPEPAPVSKSHEAYVPSLADGVMAAADEPRGSSRLSAVDPLVGAGAPAAMLALPVSDEVALPAAAAAQAVTPESPDGPRPAPEPATARPGIAQAAVSDREAQSAAVIDREARSAAVSDREARSAAVTDREARSAAVSDREARSAAVADREARSAVADREARSAAVTVREARSAAVVDREARSTAVTAQPLLERARSGLRPGPIQLPLRETTAVRETSALRAGTPLALPIGDGPAPPLYDLQRAAKRLLGDPDREAAVASRAPATLPSSRSQQIFDRQRSRIFTALWISLGLVCFGALLGWGVRTATTAVALRRYFAEAARLSGTGTYEGALEAQKLYQQALVLAPRNGRVLARSAELEARLAADHGEDSEDRAFTLLRRAKKILGGAAVTDPGARAALRRAEMLLSLSRGEPCPTLSPQQANQSLEQDHDVAARCALQRGDVSLARRLLSASAPGQVHTLLWRGTLALSLGDLDEADHAFRTVLDAMPQHPRALIGRSLVQAERGQDPGLPPLPPQTRLGLVTESFWSLVQGLHALREGDNAAAAAAFDRAQAGWRYDPRLALAVARSRLSQGRVAEAEVGLRLAQRRFPSEPDVMLLDAEVALAKGHEEQILHGLASLAGPARDRPDAPLRPSPQLLSVLGRAQFLAGDYRAAAATLDSVLEQRPGDVVAASYAELCRARNGDEREAFRDLEQLASRSVAVTTPHYALAVLAYERKDLARASQEASQALDRNPDAAQARALLGRVLREEGKLGEAIGQLQQVVREAPAVVEAHKILGRIYLDLGRVRDARQELVHVTESGKQTVEDYLALADALLSLGLVADAEQVIRAASAAGATEAKVARAELVAESWKGAQQALAAARQLEEERRGNGRDGALALATAQAWLRAGDLQAALEDFDAARQKAPLLGALGVGRVQLRLRNQQEAEAAYRAALQQWERAPYGLDERAEARAGLCRALLLRGTMPEVLEAALEAVAPSLSEDPSYVDTYVCQGRVLSEQRRVGEALAAARRAVELDGHDGEACILLADVMLKLGDQQGGRERYQRCLELALGAAQQKHVRGVLANLK